MCTWPVVFYIIRGKSFRNGPPVFFMFGPFLLWWRNVTLNVFVLRWHNCAKVVTLESVTVRKGHWENERLASNDCPFKIWNLGKIMTLFFCLLFFFFPPQSWALLWWFKVILSVNLFRTRNSFEIASLIFSVKKKSSEESLRCCFLFFFWKKHLKNVSLFKRLSFPTFPTGGGM